MSATDSTPLLKHISPLIQWGKDYATWELIGAVTAFFGKDLFKKAAKLDFDRAMREASMTLTPDGWEKQQRRFEDSDPIRPR